MPMRPKTTATPRLPTQQPKQWQSTGVDLRRGFRGLNRKKAKQQILVRDGYACCECGAIVDAATSHLDHIVPLSHGGTHEEHNLQTLCHRCSNRKTAREAAKGRRAAK